MHASKEIVKRAGLGRWVFNKNSAWVAWVASWSILCLCMGDFSWSQFEGVTGLLLKQAMTPSKAQTCGRRMNMCMHGLAIPIAKHLWGRLLKIVQGNKYAESCMYLLWGQCLTQVSHCMGPLTLLLWRGKHEWKRNAGLTAEASWVVTVELWKIHNEASLRIWDAISSDIERYFRCRGQGKSWYMLACNSLDVLEACQEHTS